MKQEEGNLRTDEGSWWADEASYVLTKNSGAKIAPRDRLLGCWAQAQVRLTRMSTQY